MRGSTVDGGMAGRQNIEGLAAKFGKSLSLSDKEKGGIKIEKKAVEGALLGFHYSVVAEVFSMKPVNENAFIDQFTSLWRGREGVSIRALGGMRFMARFVGQRDMCRVLEAEKPWLFRDDLVLVVDGERRGRWADSLHFVTMWVQIHGVPPLNMTKAVARAIGGLLGTVIRVDKDDGRDCIGRFLRVKITFDVREPLMRGANVDFLEEGTMWTDFRYEGLPSYCLICGKMGHVTQWCKSHRIGEDASGVEVEALIAFKGLDAKYDLRGNWFMAKGGGLQRLGGLSASNISSNGGHYNVSGGDVGGSRAQEEEVKESQRVERERAFDAGLIGPSGVIAPAAGLIELVSHPDELEGNGESFEVIPQVRNIDLNMPLVEGITEKVERIHGESDVGGGGEQRSLSQDSDPFNLLPIIEVVSTERLKRSREDEEDAFIVAEDGLAHMHKIQRSIVDLAETTYEESPRSQ
ncbi:hypothetical protein ACFX2I_015707 [Malus domestica]